MDYKWYNLNAPNAGDLDYKWYSLSGIQANLDYKQLQSYECLRMGTKLATVKACPECHRLHDKIYGQDVTGTTHLCRAKEGSHAEKDDHRLTRIGHLALQDRIIHPRGVVLHITIKYHC